ncbi:MAG: glycosyltransferase family 4 protein [Acidilobus sp.]
METLRIVMVSDWFPPRVGGVETSVEELSRALSAMGHEVIVVTHQNRARPYPPTLESRDGYYVYWDRSRLNARDEVTVDPLTVARAALFVKRNAADVVHSHGLSSILSFMTAIVASGGTGAPSVLTNHSLVDDSLGWLTRRLLRYALKWPTRLVGVSRAAAEDVSRISGRPASVVHNCIDVRRWRSLAGGQRLDGDPAIVITSRLSPRKNPLEIAAVVSLVTRELPRAKFYVVGDGLLREGLREAARARGVENNIVMMGTIPRERVASVLSGADAFALTSYRESFGLAVLEAMALGVTPIVYRSPGVLDLVEDGVSGLIVDGPEGMAKAIVELYYNETLRSRLSSAAAERAESFDCSLIARRYLDEYRAAEEGKCRDDRRFLVYKAFRLLTGDPVRPCEWSRDRKWRYHERAREGIVPVIRRGAGRPSLPQ